MVEYFIYFANGLQLTAFNSGTLIEPPPPPIWTFFKKFLFIKSVILWVNRTH